VGVSKTTARWVGFCFWRTSSRASRNPKTAEVFRPLEVILGFLMNA